MEMTTLLAEVWVVPVCKGLKSSWTLLPKAYTKKGYAISGGKAHKRSHKTMIVGEPVRLHTEIELPDCDSCLERFRCYTNRA